MTPVSNFRGGGSAGKTSIREPATLAIFPDLRPNPLTKIQNRHIDSYRDLRYLKRGVASARSG